MKKLVKLVTLVLILGGWGLAASAVQVIRIPGKFVVITKDRLTFANTYLDARSWTLSDDKAHPDVVEHLVRIDRSDVLDHTVLQGVDTKTQLVAVLATSNLASAAPQPSVLDQAKTAGAKIVNDVKNIK